MDQEVEGNVALVPQEQAVRLAVLSRKERQLTLPSKGLSGKTAQEAPKKVLKAHHHPCPNCRAAHHGHSGGESGRVRIREVLIGSDLNETLALKVAHAESCHDHDADEWLEMDSGDPGHAVGSTFPTLLPYISESSDCRRATRGEGLIAA